MREKVEQSVRCLLVSQLLAVGLLLPVLAVLGISSWWQTGCVYLALVTLGMQLLLFLPHGKACAWGAVAVMAAAWAATGGLQTAREVIRGIVLALQGRNLAIPVIADRAVPLLGVAAALLACLSAGEEAEGVLASILTIGVMYALLAYGGSSAWYLLLPAAGATVFLLANGMRRDMGRIRIAVVAAALCLLVFFLVPRGGLTVAPLKEAADAIRQKIDDYFFFTQPRTMFTLAAEGYYPMGGDQLGGPANPTDHPVMTVITPRKVYLRGAVKDRYTGRAWRDTLGDMRYLWVSPQWRELRDATFDMRLPEEADLPASRIRVDITSENASDLFVPQRVRNLSVSSDMVPYFNRGSGLFITRNLQPGDVYTVSAVTAVAGDPGLEEIIARAASRGNPARDAETAAVYLALPDHLQQQVYELARTAAGGASTPYGKAMAIRNWLQANCRYNLDVPEQNPSQDFVSTFLLVTREGYCTYFASAMTVLCRMEGIPARYVEGYTAKPGADGVAYVTGKNGHAWTEIWLSGYGWLTIDATGFDDQDQTPEDPKQDPEQNPDQNPDPDQSPPATPTPQPQGSPEGLFTPTPPPDQPPENDPSPDRNPPFPWLWTGLLLLLALALLGRAHLRRMRPENMAARERDEAGRWSVWMQAVCDALQVLGETRPPQLTMAQWLREVDGRRPVNLELAPLGECAAVVFYGQLEPLAEETEMAREAYRALHGVLNRRQRFRLAIARLRKRPWRP